MDHTLVAVYGSLRKGLHNHRLLANARCLGIDYIPNFNMFSMGSFPFLKPVETLALTTVEVYNASPEEFRNLDRLEGYPSFYDRKQVPTTYGSAWVYFIDRPNTTHQLITSGDWKEHYTGEA